LIDIKISRDILKRILLLKGVLIMRTVLPISNFEVVASKSVPPQVNPVESSDELWSSLELASDGSPNLAKWRSVSVEGRVIPSYVLIGPRGGSVPIRLALLGCTDGDDLLSTTAIVKLLVELDLAPLLAQDFALFGYPIANPHRNSGPAPDFETQFWREVDDPVIRFFERELAGNELDGVIVIKGNEPISGFQIQVSSRVIATEVLWPALELAQRLVPLASEPIQLYPQLQRRENAFFSLDHVRPRPFSLVIRTPANVPFENQVSAVAFSIKQILHHYRALVGHADSL
jgi:hypothetical protein